MFSSTRHLNTRLFHTYGPLADSSMAYRNEDMNKPCYSDTNAMPRQGPDSRVLHVGVTEGDVAQRIITCGTLERARAQECHT